jgi:hypothetical protein
MRRKSLDADEQIEEMTQKLASLDRRLANLQRLRRNKDSRLPIRRLSCIGQRTQRRSAALPSACAMPGPSVPCSTWR